MKLIDYEENESNGEIYFEVKSWLWNLFRKRLEKKVKKAYLKENSIPKGTCCTITVDLDVSCSAMSIQLAKETHNRIANSNEENSKLSKEELKELQLKEKEDEKLNKEILKSEKKTYEKRKKEHLKQLKKHAKEFEDFDYCYMVKVVCDMIFLYYNRFSKDSIICFDPKSPDNHVEELREGLKRCAGLAFQWIKGEDAVTEELFSTIAKNITKWWD